MHVYIRMYVVVHQMFMVTGFRRCWSHLTSRMYHQRCYYHHWSIILSRHHSVQTTCHRNTQTRQSHYCVDGYRVWLGVYVLIAYHCLLLIYSYHSNLQIKVRPLQTKVASMKNSLTENISRLKVMEEKYEVHNM